MSCNIGDIVLLEDVTQFWSVDKEGQAVSFQDSTDSEFREYKCDVHYEEFNDWDDVLEHLEENSDEVL